MHTKHQILYRCFLAFLGAETRNIHTAGIFCSKIRLTATQVVYSAVEFDKICDVLTTISKNVAFSYYTNTKRLMLQGTKENIEAAKETFIQKLNLYPDETKPTKHKMKNAKETNTNTFPVQQGPSSDYLFSH